MPGYWIPHFCGMTFEADAGSRAYWIAHCCGMTGENGVKRRGWSDEREAERGDGIYSRSKNVPLP